MDVILLLFSSLRCGQQEFLSVSVAHGILPSSPTPPQGSLGFAVSITWQGRSYKANQAQFRHCFPG